MKPAICTILIGAVTIIMFTGCETIKRCNKCNTKLEHFGPCNEGELFKKDTYCPQCQFLHKSMSEIAHPYNLKKIGGEYSPTNFNPDILKHYTVWLDTFPDGDIYHYFAGISKNPPRDITVHPNSAPEGYYWCEKCGYLHVSKEK